MYLTLGELKFLQPHDVAVFKGQDLHSLVVQQALEGLDQLQVRRGCHIVPPSHGFIVPATIFTLLYSCPTGHISKLWKLVKSITDDILFISLKINEQIIVYDFFLFKMSFQNCMMTSFFNISPIEQIEVVFPPKNFTNKRY